MEAAGSHAEFRSGNDLARLTGYLLDTNVISESVRAAPAPEVMRWLDSLEPEQWYVSVLSLGEVRKCALAVADKRRREKLHAWLQETLPEWFEHRVRSIDAGVCERRADLMVKAGTPLPAIDSLVVATAAHADWVVATRNLLDFSRLDVKVFNPWTTGR